MNFARALTRNSTLAGVESAAIGRDYKARIARNRTLISGSIELTYRCNLHCTHCYCPPSERSEELSTSEIIDVIDEMVSMGCLFLLLTGGDPLLRKDFPEIYRHAKQRGMLVTVFTNGTLINDRIIALWDELPPAMVEISLYGLTREVYEQVVAVKGSYDRCMDGIARVLAAGHPLALKCPATTENAHEIPGLQAFAKDLGIEFRYDPAILATMRGEKHPHALRLSPEQIVALEQGDAEKDRAWSQYLGEQRENPPEGQKLFTCGAGKNSLHVDPTGNVQVCLMVKNFRHSLRERPLREIYEQEFPKIRAIEREPDAKCSSCASRSTCHNCPGVALWETQNQQSHVEFQCSLTAVREQTYGGALDDAAPAPTGCGSCASGGGCGSSGGGCGSGTLLQIGGIG
ncbi:MAG: radical SAM protein [Myxococcota bacterium]